MEPFPRLAATGEAPPLYPLKRQAGTMARGFPERAGSLPALDNLKDHLPPPLLSELEEFIRQLVSSRRALQAECERCRHERDRFRTALLGALDIDGEDKLQPFLRRALELVAHLCGADVAAVFLEPEAECDNTGAILVTRHCTDTDLAFVKQELYSENGLLYRARLSGSPAMFQAEEAQSERIEREFGRRHAKSAVALPFLGDPGKPARGVLYLEHMSREHAFDDDMGLVRACLDFMSGGVTARERHDELLRRCDHTAPYRESGRYAHLAGRSRAFARVLARLELLRTSEVEAPVLFVGQPGTGKRTLAQTAHEFSRRARGPFLVVDCQETAPEEQAARLFGTATRHARTADPTTRGAFTTARGGSVYLENVHCLAESMQDSLLRALETRCYAPEGAELPSTLDARLFCSSPESLRALAARGVFSAALAERLSLFQVSLPPLRDRREDIIPLAEHFLQKANQAGGRSGPVFSAAALRELERQAWPGNLDELRNRVERAASACVGNVVDIHRVVGAATHHGTPEARIGDWKSELNAFQCRLIRKAMARSGGSVPRAAALLNISRQYLNSRLKLLGLESLRGTGQAGQEEPGAADSCGGR